jgi:hydrogenase maturation protease
MATTPDIAGCGGEAGLSRAPLLVLGLGNILLRDEGIGVHVIEALRAAALPADVELCDGGTAGFALLDVLADRRKVIVVDAVDSGAAPGTIVRLTVADLVGRSGVRVSLHEVGFAETLQAAQHLGVAPRELVILGVQPRVVALGLELSPELAQLVAELAKRVVAELEGRGPADRPGMVELATSRAVRDRGEEVCR